MPNHYLTPTPDPDDWWSRLEQERRIKQERRLSQEQRVVPSPVPPVLGPTPIAEDRDDWWSRLEQERRIKQERGQHGQTRLGELGSLGRRFVDPRSPFRKQASVGGRVLWGDEAVDQEGNIALELLDLLQGGGEIGGSLLREGLGVLRNPFAAYTNREVIADRPFAETLGAHLEAPLKERIPLEIAGDPLNIIPLGLVARPFRAGTRILSGLGKTTQPIRGLPVPISRTGPAQSVTSSVMGRTPDRAMPLRGPVGIAQAPPQVEPVSRAIALPGPVEVPPGVAPSAPEVISRELATETPTVPTVAKEPYNMTKVEFEDTLERLRVDEANIEVELFGEDGAQIYKRAQLILHTSSPNSASMKAADKTIADMEVGLTEAQFDLLEGRRLPGERPFPAESYESLKEFQDAFQDLSDMDTSFLLGQVTRGLSRVRGNKIREFVAGTGKLTDPEQIAAMKIRNALQLLNERGMSQEQIFRQVGQSLSRDIDPADAEFLLRDFMEGGPRATLQAPPPRPGIGQQATPLPEQPGPIAGVPEGAPLRFDPQTNRYNGDELVPGTLLTDDTGTMYRVDRRLGFMLTLDELKPDGSLARTISYSVDRSDTSRYKALYKAEEITPPAVAVPEVVIPPAAGGPPGPRPLGAAVPKPQVGEEALDVLREPSGSKEPWEMTADEFTRDRTVRLSISNEEAAVTRLVRVGRKDSSGTITVSARQVANAAKAAGMSTRTLQQLDTPFASIARVGTSQRFFVTQRNVAAQLGHKDSVIQALSEGKPIPLEVLSDYPDLAIRAPSIAAPQPGIGQQATILPEQPGPIAGPPGPPPLGAATQLPPSATPQVAPVVPGNIISRIVRTSAGRFFIGEDTTRLMDKNLNALTVDELNGVLAEALRGVSSSSPGVSRDADRLANALFEEAARRGLRREQLETNIWPTFTAPETAIAPSQVPETPLAGVPPIEPAALPPIGQQATLGDEFATNRMLGMAIGDPSGVRAAPLIDPEQVTAQGERARLLREGQEALPESPGSALPSEPSRADEIENRLYELGAEIEAVGQGRKVIRPRWANGGWRGSMSNETLKQLAAHEGLDPYQRDWFDSIDSELIRQFRREPPAALGREPTLLDLRMERRRLTDELGRLEQEASVRPVPEVRPIPQAQRALDESLPGQAPRVNDAPTGDIKPAPLGADPHGPSRPGGRELITVGEELEAAPRPPGPGQPMTPEAAKTELTGALYDAVPDSPIDVAASRYWRDGDIQRYVSDIPPANNIPIANEFIDHEFAHVGRVNAMSMDPTRLLQTIDGGIFNGPLQKYVLWPTRRLFMGSMRFGDEQRQIVNLGIEAHGMNRFRSKRLRQLAGDVIEHISLEDARLSEAELISKPAIKKILRASGVSLEAQARIVGYAKDTRNVLDDLLRVQNLARAKRGQDAIPMMDNYKPWVIKTNLWNRLGFTRKLPSEVMDKAPIPDFIYPDAPFNPRAEARTGGLANYPRERDLGRLVDDYIDTATRDIFFTDIIRNAKAHTDAMRFRGFDGPASTIDDWISESFAGTQTAAAKFVRGFVPRPAVEGALMLRRSLTRAVFPLNWTWNLGVQTSSLLPTFVRYGPVNTLKGLDYILSPTAKHWVQENAYSSIVKGRRGGRISEQGSEFGNTPQLSSRLKTTPLDTAMDIANFLTNVIEDNLTGLSVRAAYHNGKTRGLTGRALAEWSSEGGSKTQSMYNIHDRPGILRSPEVQAMAPFMTFAYEMFNTVREVISPIGRVGAFKASSRSGTERLRQLLTFIGGMYAINMAGEAYLNRKPWVVSSFVPFYGLLVGGMNPGSPFGEPLPRAYQADFTKGVGDVIKRGNWNRFRRWVIKYHVPAGTQANRTIEGLMALSKGGVSDTAGRELYKVDPDDWFTAITRGPSQTEGGREYVDKQRERRGPFSDILGFNVPTPFSDTKSDTKQKGKPGYRQFVSPY